MTRILRAALAVTLLSTYFSTVLAQQATQTQEAGAVSTLDCYDTLGPNSNVAKQDTFMTDGVCQGICAGQGFNVMMTSGGYSCYCGDTVPPASAKVDNDLCNIGCGGYKQQDCGGVGVYRYYLTGLGAPILEKDNSTTSAKPSATSSATSTANPIIVTETPKGTPESSGGGSSKVGIAVGVVVGVLAIAALVGGGIFFYKRRRNQQLQEEHARNAAISGFAKGPKSEASSANDSRLDPSIYSAQRDSLGSIADSRDFSRRILQVTTLAMTIVKEPNS